MQPPTANWWTCTVPSPVTGRPFAVYFDPRASQADAESWCQMIGGTDLGRVVMEVDTKAEAVETVDALNCGIN